MSLKKTWKNYLKVSLLNKIFFFQTLTYKFRTTQEQTPKVKQIGQG